MILYRLSDIQLCQCSGIHKVCSACKRSSNTRLHSLKDLFIVFEEYFGISQSDSAISLLNDVTDVLQPQLVKHRSNKPRTWVTHVLVKKAKNSLTKTGIPVRKFQKYSSAVVAMQ